MTFKNTLLVLLVTLPLLVVAAPTPPKTEFYWTPPIENTDGSTLTNLAGYKIYCGDHVFDLSDPLAMNITFLDAQIPDGMTSCKMTAYNSIGEEGAYSDEIGPFIFQNGQVKSIVPAVVGFGVR